MNINHVAFVDLPRDVLLQVLSFVEAEDVAQVSKTCKNLRSLSYDATLWRSIVDCRWGLDEKPPYISWRDLHATLAYIRKSNLWAHLVSLINSESALCFVTER